MPIVNVGGREAGAFTVGDARCLQDLDTAGYSLYSLALIGSPWSRMPPVNCNQKKAGSCWYIQGGPSRDEDWVGEEQPPGDPFHGPQ